MRFVPSLKQIFVTGLVLLVAGVAAIAIAVRVVAIPQASEIASAITAAPNPKKASVRICLSDGTKRINPRLSLRG